MKVVGGFFFNSHYKVSRKKLPEKQRKNSERQHNFSSADETSI